MLSPLSCRCSTETSAPCWEPRWAVTVVVTVAIGLQWALPSRFCLQPQWLLPALDAVLLCGLIVGNPSRIEPGARG
jgi:hypothetical protein